MVSYNNETSPLEVVVEPVVVPLVVPPVVVPLVVPLDVVGAESQADRIENDINIIRRPRIRVIFRIPIFIITSIFNMYYLP